MYKLNIAVFFGGCSSEYRVSLQSACGVINALDKRKYNVLKVWITNKGDWFYFEGDTADIANNRLRTEQSTPAALSPNRSSHELLLLKDGGTERLHIDAALPVMHGRNGEDGSLQGLIRLAGIPLAGCDVLSSALCMDKYRAHLTVRAAGIAVPKTVLISSSDRRNMIAAYAATLGFPLFVKPLRAGSSLGISRVNRLLQLEQAVKIALNYDKKVVLEESVNGCEVGCAVIGNDTLTTGEVDMINLFGDFLDYSEKYSPKTSNTIVPANISKEKAEQIKSTAVCIYKALDCSGFARVDMFLTEQGEIIFNEVNTIPGFTVNSRFPRMMEAAGFSLTQVLDMIIEGAIK